MPNNLLLRLKLDKNEFFHYNKDKMKFFERLVCPKCYSIGLTYATKKVVAGRECILYTCDSCGRQTIQPIELDRLDESLRKQAI